MLREAGPLTDATGEAPTFMESALPGRNPWTATVDLAEAIDAQDATGEAP
jgi:hypothetical protein